MKRLASKTALVTGGAQGLGASHAARLVSEGAHVVVADVLETEGRAAAAQFGPAASYVCLDVTSEQSWAEALEEVVEKRGGVDILVNNAGVIVRTGIETTSVDDFMLQLRVNLLGTFIGMRTVLPTMRRQRGGSIVNISSTAGLIGFPHQAGYVASKWGVRGITKSAAVELGGTGIRVNSVHPGPVRTPMTTGLGAENAARQPIARVAEPEEVSALVAFLASDESSYCTGAEFTVDGGRTVQLV